MIKIRRWRQTKSESFFHGQFPLRSFSSVFLNQETMPASQDISAAKRKSFSGTYFPETLPKPFHCERSRKAQTVLRSCLFMGHIPVELIGRIQLVIQKPDWPVHGLLIWLAPLLNARRRQNTFLYFTTSCTRLQ